MAHLNVMSIGRLAVALQQPVPRVAKALERLGIGPELTINSIPHYQADAYTLLLVELAKEAGRMGGKPTILS